MYKKLILLFVFMFWTQISFAQGTPFYFLNNLYFGISSPDVLELQKVLNKDSATTVSSFGAGSAGFETQYFGEKTQDAVVRFQNKYASEILIPLGLSSGTGFVGNSTRAKLNSLSLTTTPLTSTTPTTPLAPPIPPTQHTTPLTPTPPSQFNLFTEADNATVQLAFLSVGYGAHGSTLEFTGSGFLPTGNKIIFGSNVVSGVSAVSSNKISFIIPDSIPAGIYDVEISNQKGTSDSNSSFIVVNDAVAMPPKIINVSPLTSPLGGEITILGENFTPTGNIVRSSLGVFNNISSPDGKTLKMTLREPASSGLARLFAVDNNFKFKVFISVVNIHGVSDNNNPGIITLVK